MPDRSSGNHLFTKLPQNLLELREAFRQRQNLTMRMRMRRFTRLTNAFSKKIENLEHAVALYFMHYNFIRVHQTLKTTPAVAAGVASHVWTMEDLVAMMERLQEKKKLN